MVRARLMYWFFCVLRMPHMSCLPAGMGSSKSAAACHVDHVEHVEPAATMPSEQARTFRPIDASDQNPPRFDPFVISSTRAHDRTLSDTRETYVSPPWRHQPLQQRQLAHQMQTAMPMPGSLFYNEEAGQQLPAKHAFQAYPFHEARGATPSKLCSLLYVPFLNCAVVSLLVWLWLLRMSPCYPG